MPNPSACIMNVHNYLRAMRADDVPAGDSGLWEVQKIPVPFFTKRPQRS